MKLLCRLYGPLKFVSKWAKNNRMKWNLAQKPSTISTLYWAVFEAWTETNFGSWIGPSGTLVRIEKLDENYEKKIIKDLHFPYQLQRSPSFPFHFCSSFSTSILKISFHLHIPFFLLDLIFFDEKTSISTLFHFKFQFHLPSPLFTFLFLISSSLSGQTSISTLFHLKFKFHLLHHAFSRTRI